MIGEDADSGYRVGAMSKAFLGLRQQSAHAADRFDRRGPIRTMPRSPFPASEELSGWEQRLAASE